MEAREAHEVQPLTEEEMKDGITPLLRFSQLHKALKVRVAYLEQANRILLKQLEELKEEISTTRDGERYRALLTMALWGKEKISSLMALRYEEETPKDSCHECPKVVDELDVRTLDRIQKKIINEF